MVKKERVKLMLKNERMRLRKPQITNSPCTEKKKKNKEIQSE
jgi:hypothetical protein